MDASAHIKQLVESSAVLSEAERKEWLDLLPFMNDKQQSELLLILQPPVTGDAGAIISASSSPVQPALSVPSTPPVSASVIGQSMNAVPPDAPGANLPPASATTVSAFLNKNFASELHRGSMPGSFKTESIAQPSQTQSLSSPTLPETTPAAQVKFADPVRATSAPASPAASLPSFGTIKEQKKTSTSPAVPPLAQKQDGPLGSVLPTAAGVDAPEQREPVINVQSLEAVRMLNVATLRGKGVMNLETELKGLCEKFGYFSVQFAFEQSPLYQAYIAVGARILKDHQTFEEVQAALAAAGRPYLAKPEFEEFSDLLRRLKGHA